MNDELRRVVEAILFAAARKLELEEIAKLCKRPEGDVLEVLKRLQAELKEENSPTMLVQEGSAWKLTVHEKYIPVIKRVVTKTELPKSILETLAVVAYKAPVLQSKVIKIRTNKAYDHLNFLENSGFITREKSGRTKLIKLAPKFFEYFDVDPQKLKQKWRNPQEVEKAIEAKEKEIEQIEEKRRKVAGEQLEAPEIVLDGKSLETYDAVVPSDMELTGVTPYTDEVEGLEVYNDEGPKGKVKKAGMKAGESQDEVAAAVKALHEESEGKEEPEESEAKSEEPEKTEEEPEKELPEDESAEDEKEPEEEGQPEEEPEEEKEEQPEERRESEGEQEVKEEQEEKPEVEEGAEEEKSEEKAEETKQPEKEEQASEEKQSEGQGEKSEVKKPVKKAAQKPKASKPVLEQPEEEISPSKKLAKEVEEHKGKAKPRSFEKGKGLFPKGVPKEMASRIDERIDAILGKKPEKSEESDEEKKE